MQYSNLIIIILGLSFIVWRRPVAKWIYDVQRPWFKALYSWAIDVDAVWFRRSYDIAVVGAGVVLLLIAAAAYFGPVSL